MRALVGHLEDFRDHPNADRLDLVDFVSDNFRHQLVVGKHYQDGERGFYVPVGEPVPDGIAEEMWLLGKLGGQDKNLVEPRNIRGIVSEGLFYGTVGKHWDDSFVEGDWIIFDKNSEVVE